MKRSEIKVGMRVAVFIDGAYAPHGRVGFGSSDSTQLSDRLQAERMPSKTYSNDRQVFQAKVVEVGAERYARASSRHNIWEVKRDGVLVRLPKKIKGGWYGEHESDLFVARSQQVVSTWADVEAGRRAAKAADAEWSAKCDAFAPRLDRFLGQLRAAGFKDVAVHRDGSGLYARGLAVTLRHYRGRAYAFASIDSVRIDFKRFIDLLGVEAEVE